MPRCWTALCKRKACLQSPEGSPDGRAEPFASSSFLECRHDGRSSSILLNREGETTVILYLLSHAVTLSYTLPQGFCTPQPSPELFSRLSFCPDHASAFFRLELKSCFLQEGFRESMVSYSPLGSSFFKNDSPFTEHYIISKNKVTEEDARATSVPQG